MALNEDNKNMSDIDLKSTDGEAADSKSTKKGSATAKKSAGKKSKSGDDFGTPDEKLTELQESVSGSETEFDELKKSLTIQKSDLSILEKLITERDKILAAYAKALPDFQQQKENSTHYSEFKTPQIELAVKDKKAEIETIINRENETIQNLESELETLESDMESKRQDYDRAKEILERAGQQFELTKTLQKLIATNFKSITNLHDEIEKKETESRYAVMYFLMNELNMLLEETKDLLIYTPESFKIKLNKDWFEMDAATKAFRDKEESYNLAQTACTAKEAELANAKADKRTRILEKLSEIQFT